MISKILKGKCKIMNNANGLSFKRARSQAITFSKLNVELFNWYMHNPMSIPISEAILKYIARKIKAISETEQMT